MRWATGPRYPPIPTDRPTRVATRREPLGAEPGFAGGRGGRYALLLVREQLTAGALAQSLGHPKEDGATLPLPSGRLDACQQARGEQQPPAVGQRLETADGLGQWPDRMIGGPRWTKQSPIAVSP